MMPDVELFRSVRTGDGADYYALEYDSAEDKPFAISFVERHFIDMNLKELQLFIHDLQTMERKALLGEYDERDDWERQGA